MKFEPANLQFKNITDITKLHINVDIYIFVLLQGNNIIFTKNKAIQNHIGIHIGRAIDGFSNMIPNIGFVMYSSTEKEMSVLLITQTQYPNKLKKSTGINKRFAVFFIDDNHSPSLCKYPLIIKKADM